MYLDTLAHWPGRPCHGADPTDDFSDDFPDGPSDGDA